MISEYLEDIFAPLGRKAGIAPSDMSLVYTPQIIASLIQVPVNWTLTEFGARVFDAIVGLGSAIAVGLGAVKGKAALELSEMASYWLTNIYVPPAKASVVTQQAVSFVTALTSGNIQAATNALYQGQNFTTNALAGTALVNPVSYQTGTATPISVPTPTPIPMNSSSSGSSSSTSSSTVTITSSPPASSLLDPKPQTSNQRTLALLA
ncbi:MAG: hypothetical protein QW578_05730 [Thermoplasmatales archaeon]